ncbi:peptide deformylase [Tsukamurella ocularis]|uniref:peptide deformylase n=1 Tax=Tsukamurella ocularis TaxID=1970234 RepID=UPI002169069E|nr:peptide deformylase [Tsukamurella ocularis]MCS3778789.1 peptide deformylase [Tsukamurella ocularis]MCS3787591.1 peptide deformylase [Tsukamurella ocularis]MCS3851472.1 peptide deformylase [Tsukamurella ocularis]
MSVLPIVIVGDPVLHSPTTPVELDADGKPSAEIVTLLDDMYETMDVANGVGLAGNQVGRDLRLFVYDCPDEETGERRRGEVINPVLTTSDVPETMPDPDDDWEGCLSVPGESFPTGRAEWAKVVGTDRAGEKVQIEGTGFFARMLQHETGHLDGFLYTDVLTGRYARQAKKFIKKQGWTVPGLTWMPGTVEDPFGH